jgi:S-(hydroxymethyl)glutathione dehydrogenase/alcohol dehydrogenase
MLCNGRTNPDGTLFDGTTRMRRLSGETVYHYGRISCFAEHAVLPEEQLLPCGDDVPPQHAALVGCAVITGFGAVMNTARIEVGSDVAVIGCGGIGLNVIQAARMLGARRIVAVDVDERHLGYARDFGATDVVDARAGDPVAAIRAATDGGPHYTFDAYGSPATMEQAFAAVRAGGTAVQIGLSAEGATGAISPFELAVSEKTLKGSFMGSSRPRVDMPRLLDLYRLGRLPLERLVTRTYGLDEINEAYADLQRGANARGVIVLGG